MARDPRMEAPLEATTGQIRQKTPTGESLRMMSMHFMKTTPKEWIPFAAGAASSPARMMAKPIRMAMTMTWSMMASDMG